MPMRFTAAALAFVFAVPATYAAEVHAVAMAPATMEELSQVDLPAPVAIHIHRRSHSFSSGETLDNATIAATATIPAPAVGTTFQDDNDANVYPPDAGGAVSRNVVVSVNNKGINVRDRSGALRLHTSINQFWHDPAFPDGTLYDTRLSYDAAADRFVIVALYDHGGVGNNSTFLFAATATGDPTGAWYRYRVAVDPANNNSADFTRLALANSQAIATANIYVGAKQDPSYAAVWTIPKNLLYSGAPSPIATVSDTPSGSIDAAPVATIDSGDPRVWVVTTTSAGMSALDVSTSFQSALHFNAPIPILTDFTTNFGAQLGSGIMLDTGDMVPQYGLIRNHVLWVVQTAEPASGPARTSILAYRVDLSTNTMTNVLIDDSSGATDFGFPSIAVNRNGGVLLAYAQYNAAYYTSAAFTYIDPAGNTTASTFLKQGMSPYSLDRWADFTTAVVDPVDDTSFWTVQVLPMTTQAWSTWWFNVPVTTPPPKHRAARK